MAIAIRTAVPEDLAAVQRLNAALFIFEDELGSSDHSRKLNWPYATDGAAYFTKCLAGQDGNIAFVAEAQGTVVGYLAACVYERSWMSLNPIAELSNMFVEPDFRRQGVGGQLMDAFKTWAHQQQARRLKVGAATGNQSALAFYRRHGFHEMETYLEQ